MVKFDEAKALELYKQGEYDTEIAKKLGMNKTTIRMWRTRRGMPANKRMNVAKQPKKISKLSLDARAARAAGMNYGVWKALGN